VRPLLRAALAARLLRWALVAGAAACLLVLPQLVFSLAAPDHSVVGKYFDTDDAYYYFQIARNIAAGHGSTFDQVTLTNGFHPLWMAVLVPIYAVAHGDPFFPLRVILVVQSIFHWLAALFLLLALRRVGLGFAGAICALLWLMLSPRWNMDVLNGTEMALNLCLTASLLFLLALAASMAPAGNRRTPPLWLAALIGLNIGLLFLARLDNVFMLLVLGAGYVVILLWKGGLRSIELGRLVQHGFVLILPLAVFGLAYVVLSLFVYGAFLPVSGQVKHYWYSIGGSVFGPPPLGPLSSLAAYFSRASSKVVSGPIVGLDRYWALRRAALPVAAGFVFGGLRGRRALLGAAGLLTACLIGASLIHPAYYALVGYVQSREWYWVTEYMAILWLIALGLSGLLEVRLPPAWRLVVAGVAITAMLVWRLPGYAAWVAGQFQFRPSDGSDYFDRAAFLERHTPPSAVIGTPNAGGLAYLSDRRVVNIDGLVNSYGFLAAMRNGQADRYLEQMGVDYIFIGPGYTAFQPYAQMLDGHLRWVAEWSPYDVERTHDLFRFQLRPR
jgi:hypothetical protein